MPEVISQDGTAIGYDLMGEGPLVILVAGATQYRGIDRTRMPGLQRQLARRYSVINYDRRGRGASGDGAPYAVAREVEDIAALMAAHGGEARVFGVSSGAVLAVEAAAAMPRKIKSLALYEPPIDPALSAAHYRREHQAMAALAAEGRPGEMMRQFLLGMGMSEDVLSGFEADPVWSVYSAAGLTLEHDFRLLAEARRGEAPPEHWQNAIMPALVLDGDRSFPFIAGGADWVASSLHNVERVTLADQGHEYDPAVLAPLLTVFFERGSVQVH